MERPTKNDGTSTSDSEMPLLGDENSLYNRLHPDTVSDILRDAVLSEIPGEFERTVKALVNAKLPHFENTEQGSQ